LINTNYLNYRIASITMKTLSFFFLFLVFIHTTSAQEKSTDSTEVKLSDSLTLAAKHRSNKAAILSAVLPGAGQIYNKSYWKVPVIYGGIAALVYFINFNQKNYTTFRTAYIYRNDLDSSTVDDFSNYTNDDLLVRRDYYRRNRDLCYIIAGVVYVLNIVDAYVDAHLKDFDVSDDLSLSTHPYFNIDGNGSPVAGISLCLKIGK
jgi:hypothetical protein